MTPLPVRGLWLSEDTHAALREYAWIRRTTMGDVVRAVLDEIRENKTVDSVLGVEDMTGRTRLSVKSSDEQWIEARDAAEAQGVSFHSLIRRHIIKAVREEGLL